MFGLLKALATSVRTPRRARLPRPSADRAAPAPRLPRPTRRLAMEELEARVTPGGNQWGG